MNENTLIILLHQLLFQGMFFAKNITLKRKLQKPIRGFNLEANLSIAFFTFFIAASIYLASSGDGAADSGFMTPAIATLTAVFLMLGNLVLGWAALAHLGDSWRVGVIDEQTTALVDSGIYRFSRNPFFVAYLLMFAAYTALLQSITLLLLSLAGFAMIHSMVRKEEKYLSAVHGMAYRDYQARVARYLGWPQR